ncbi:MAG: hypothetical protein P1V36_06395 [Planctomycetota bacterium]|nr:hypothetical protein [Planctomycetota bacterium]
MLHLDDVQLYDLSEAGPLLFKDPARLTREARIRVIPATRVGSALALPAPWVEAEAGRSDADPISLATYWLGRLAPAAPGARKPRRARSKLPAEGLLTAEEAAAQLFATAPALERLDREGRMPSLRVDDAVRYDAELVALMAAEPENAEAAEARRTDVRAWARYEYETARTAPAPAPHPLEPLAGAPADAPTLPDTPTQPDTPSPDGGHAAPESPAEDVAGPGAYEIPKDLGFDDEPASDLLDIEGFDTVDED